MKRRAVPVEDSELAQVVEAGAVAGGEDDRVHALALAVAPHDLIGVERAEHRAVTDETLSEGFPKPDAVGDNAAAGDLVKPVCGQRVKAGLAQPVVDVLATKPLGNEPHRMTYGQRDGRDRRE